MALPRPLYSLLLLLFAVTTMSAQPGVATPGEEKRMPAGSTTSIPTNAAEDVLLTAGSGAARQGERITIPITISSPTRALSTGATRVEATLRYDRTILVFGGGVAGVTPVTAGVLRLSLPITSDSVIASLPFAVTLGSDSASTLALDSIGSDSPELGVTGVDGQFRLLDLCYADGARLINPDGIVAISKVMPNPLAGDLALELELTEKGRTSLMLYDMSGAMIRMLVDGELPVGRQHLTIEIDNVPAGHYLLVLQTPTVRATQQLRVVR